MLLKSGPACDSKKRHLWGAVRGCMLRVWARPYSLRRGRGVGCVVQEGRLRYIWARAHAVRMGKGACSTYGEGRLRYIWGRAHAVHTGKGACGTHGEGQAHTAKRRAGAHVVRCRATVHSAVPSDTWHRGAGQVLLVGCRADAYNVVQGRHSQPDPDNISVQERQ